MTMTDERPATRSRKSKGMPVRTALTATAVAVVTFFIGYFVAVRLLFPPLPVPEDGIVVPSVLGVGFDDAQAELRALGLVLGDTLGVPHSSVAPGIIVAQDPLPGQQLRAGGRIRVGVSTGLPRMTVPDVVGFRAERATNLLRRLGFEVDQRAEPSDHAEGTVLGTSPSAGTSRTLPSRVLLRVSDGTLQTADSAVVVDTVTSAIDTSTVHW